MLTAVSADQRSPVIVEAGLRVAERSGLASVNVDAVAAEAHVPSDVVTQSFANLELLVIEMGELLIAQLAAAVTQALEMSIGPRALTGSPSLRELLHNGLSAVWPVIETTANRQILAFEFTTYALRHRAGTAGVIAVEQYRAMDTGVAAFLQICAVHTGTRWLEPIEVMARFSIAVLDGLVLRWLVDRDGIAVLTELDDLAALIAAKAVSA